jgi:sensor histidine kinase YesM
MQIQKNLKQETLVYLVLWTVLFVAPVISIQFHHSDSEVFPWNELFNVWFQMLSLLLVFLFHNYLLAPLLVRKKRRLLYFSSIALLSGCFILLQCVHKPEHKSIHHHEMTEQRPPLPFDEADGGRRKGPQEHIRPGHRRPDPIPPLFGQHDFIATLLLILMLGMNIGVKLYFKQRQDERLLDHLEKENLQQQLEYLRYQINPHFLMNTLNNIHALVDIDSERAKETIVELSKIMRYALYEGSHPTVPLSRDIAFLQSYIQLMRLRYTEKVVIQVQMPDILPDSNIPPMIFVTFVENAFKHGVSYRQESFVDIRLEVTNNKLIFTCRNSKHSNADNLKSEGGVGLQNVQRRLQLLYADRHKLNITDDGTVYNVRLEIPTNT